MRINYRRWLVITVIIVVALLLGSCAFNGCRSGKSNLDTVAIPQAPPVATNQVVTEAQALPATNDWTTVPGLLAIVTAGDTPHDVRIQAAKAIAANPRGAEKNTADIVKCVTIHYDELAWGFQHADHDTHVRHLIRCLGEIGPSALPALPVLEKMLKHEQRLVDSPNAIVRSQEEQQYFVSNVALVSDAIRKISGQ